MKKTLVPLTQAQMELLVACLTYCESHPSHRDLEIVDLRERITFFSLKDKCFEPTKVFPTGIKRTKAEPKILFSMENTQVGERTERKRKYTKKSIKSNEQ